MTQQIRKAIGGIFGTVMLLAASISAGWSAQPTFPTAEAGLEAFE